MPLWLLLLSESGFRLTACRNDHSYDICRRGYKIRRIRMITRHLSSYAKSGSGWAGNFDGKVQVAGDLQATKNIIFADGAKMNTASVTATVAVCADGSYGRTGDCACSSSSKTVSSVSSPCTVTSSTGSCTAYTWCTPGIPGCVSPTNGSCCVCAP